ncbi:MAG: heparan N-sulfatase, partial [Verrucomicrobia bacterium]|nr:heparan N-sulfatase [Verrucomicrobiota bacterium]
FNASFGKLPADQLFDLRRDPDCMTNLATTVSFSAFQKQLFDELKQQGDPRMLGNGHIYDEYPYGFADKRNFYERIMRGEKIEAVKEE